MVGVIDDNYSVYTDTLNQSGTSFVNLEYTDIHTHIVGESIVITDKSIIRNLDRLVVTSYPPCIIPC
jgi:hypothetical protein